MDEIKQDMTRNKDRLVVYTALFGNYDDLIDPSEKFEGCDFVCFTDQENLKSDIWDIRLVEECDLPPNMMNRRYKILPHLYFPEYEYSLYVDSNISLLKSPRFLKDKYLLNFDFAIPRHFVRNCIFDEAMVLLRSGRTKSLDVFQQMIRYKKNGYICNDLLGENNIIIRRHNKTQDVMSDWWEELLIGSNRDQLSLMYVLWKKHQGFAFIEETSRTGEIFLLKKHNVRTSTMKYKVFLNFIFFSVPYWILKLTYLKRKESK